MIHDIAAHIVSLVSLEDHATVSALACACKSYSGLFMYFLAQNGITPVCEIVSAGRIQFATKYHGELYCRLTDDDVLWLWSGRFPESRRCHIQEGKADVILRWSFGRLTEQEIIDHRLIIWTSIIEQPVKICCFLASKYPIINMCVDDGALADCCAPLCMITYRGTDRWEFESIPTDPIVEQVGEQGLQTFLIPFKARTLLLHRHSRESR
jgi:hypothetical protein